MQKKLQRLDQPTLVIFLTFLKKITTTGSRHFLSPNGQGYSLIPYRFFDTLPITHMNFYREGRITLNGGAPWHVILDDSNCGTLCGGTILNNKFILTAAHCIELFQNPKCETRRRINFPDNVDSKS